MITTELEPIIGLEVHAQLLTLSKMFCGCSASYADSAPNSHVCAVCSGMPGSLPVINRRAVEFTLMTAFALHCDIPEISKFDRKNYSYPDLPKGYQISQYDRPLGQGGWLDYEVGGESLQCAIIRVHLEEDTGKLLHTKMNGRDVTLVDYNRSGVPLMEIVSAPDLRSPVAARQYFAALRQVLVYLGVNDGNLQEGSMRADVNVSLRRPNREFGTKVEIKNLNSFRAVERALEYEIERQRKIAESSGRIEQETRGWSEREEITVSQRIKEYAHDYRYFPEPDLPPLVVNHSELNALAGQLPELPTARRDRFISSLGLSPYTANVLTLEKALADYFEEALESGTVDPVKVANWVTQDLARLVNESGRPISESRVRPTAIARLASMVDSRLISGAAAKEVLAEMFESGEEPDVIVQSKNLVQLSNEADLERLVDEALASNPTLVETYRRGKHNVIQALMGKVMQASRGKANPPLVLEILARRLGPPSG